MSLQLKNATEKITAIKRIRERQNHLLNIIQVSEFDNLDILIDVKKDLRSDNTRRVWFHLDEFKKRIRLTTKTFVEYWWSENFTGCLGSFYISAKDIDDWIFGPTYVPIEREHLSSKTEVEFTLREKIMETFNSNCHEIIEIVLDPPMDKTSLREILPMLERRSFNIKEILTVITNKQRETLDKLKDIEYNKKLAKRHLENVVKSPRLRGEKLYLHKNTSTGMFEYFSDLAYYSSSWDRKHTSSLQKVCNKGIQPFAIGTKIDGRISEYRIYKNKGKEISKEFEDKLILDIAKTFTRYGSVAFSKEYESIKNHTFVTTK